MANRLQAWLQDAGRPSVVRRALIYAIVVGAILIVINHGGALRAGEVTGVRVIQMVLTSAVPYVVSTLSSVGAMRTAANRRSVGP